jgi:hypothetical protein
MKQAPYYVRPGDLLRLMLRVRNRIASPTAGFFLPDHDPPLLNLQFQLAIP